MTLAAQPWNTPPQQALSDVFAVANTFIDFSNEEPNQPALDQMKLQKLVYYAHAWCMANYNYQLYPEDVEAWPYGPVVRALYGSVKHYGRQTIQNHIEKTKFDSESSMMLRETPIVSDAALKGFLRQVWDTLKGFSGIQLSNMTHLQDEPWTIVRKLNDGDLSDKPTIDNELIRDIFFRKIHQPATLDQ